MASEQMVPAAQAGAAALIQRDNSNGVIALALMPEKDFEARIAAMKLGQDRMKRIQKEMMTEDEDYGVIPGTKKPALLKPGAEKVCLAYGLVPSFYAERTFGDGVSTPHLSVLTKCKLHLGSTDGPIVGEGVGSANSWERKHRYRGALRSCPKCGVEGTIKRSSFGEKGWYCHDKAGGCGEQFPADASAILNQQAGQVENPDPFDTENTLFKMSEKRAHVDATLRATATSGLFTQDVEDALADGAAATSAPVKSAGGGSTAGSSTTNTAAPATAAAASKDGNTKVKEIKTKTGSNSRGPWTLYTVSFEDGRSGTTFSDSLMTHAENAKTSGALVNPVLEKGDKGTNLTGFNAIVKDAAAPEHQEPDEPVSGPETILTVRKVDTDSGPRWVIQTIKRQVVTDLSALADAAHQARADKVGLIPAFEVVPRAQGGTVNKLTGWTAEAVPVSEPEPEGREVGAEG